MTSGSFHSIAIGTINSNREERQRRDLPDISVLADSLNRLGLIHPIVIDRENNLVAGERRLEAARSLGWTHLNCQFTDELDRSVLHAIELEENVKRKDLSWQDECAAIATYHNFRKSEDPAWAQEDTATALGITKQSVSQKLAVATELAAGNTKISTAPKFSTARGIVSRTESRKDEKALAELKAFVKPGAVEAPDPDNIINENFEQWADIYAGPKFNFIHCDFPYGIGADKFVQGAAKLHGGYEDSEDTYWRLCMVLCNALNNIASKSCHFMFWYSMHYHQRTIDFFHDNSDIKFDPFPLVWTKSDNIGIIPDPERGPRRIYETCLFGSRGDRKIVRPVSNSYAAPSVRDEHMSIKPEPMLSHFFHMFVDDSTIFLDPTCGSGSSVRAADAAGARHVLGLELNPEFADRAQAKFKSAHNLRKS